MQGGEFRAGLRVRIEALKGCKYKVISKHGLL